MKTNNTLGRKSLLALAVFVAAPSFATVDLDARYTCNIVASNASEFPKGLQSRNLSLREVAMGRIPFVGVLMDFYGPLKVHDAFAPQSDSLVLATNLAHPLEIQAAIAVTEVSPQQITLDISRVHTAQVFDKTTGHPVFVLGNIHPLERIKAECLKI